MLLPNLREIERPQCCKTCKFFSSHQDDWESYCCYGIMQKGDVWAESGHIPNEELNQRKVHDMQLCDNYLRFTWEPLV